MIDKKTLQHYVFQHYADGEAFRGIYVIHNATLGITKIGSMNRQLYWRIKELHRRHFCPMAGYNGAKEAKANGFAEPKAIDLIPVENGLDILDLEKSIHKQLKSAGHEIVISELASNNNNSESSEFYRFAVDTVTVMVNGEAVTLRVK